MINNSDVIKRLIKEFQNYDSFDLVAKLASLRLLPHNGAHSVRIDLLINIAVFLNTKSNQLIKSAKLKKIINSNYLKSSEFTRLEDPPTEAFCQEISFFKGGYRIMPGAYVELAHSLKHFLKALFLNKNPFLDKKIYDDLLAITFTVLNISERIAQKSGINRNIDIIYTDHLFVPNDSILQQKTQAIILSSHEVEEITNSLGAEPCIIDFMIADYNKIDIIDYKVGNSHLHKHPIVKVNEFYLVTDPSSLLSALIYELLERIVRIGYRKEMSRAYNEAIWDTICQNLSWLNISKLKMFPSRIHKQQPVTNGVFQYDRDKLLIVTLITEDFLSIGKEVAIINTDFLKQEFIVIHNLLCHRNGYLNEIMYLNLISSCNRSICTTELLIPYEAKSLLLSARALETISILEGGKNLFLSKYCQAINKLFESTKVISFDPLSNYGFFESKEYSFYVDDEDKPQLLFVQDDFSRSVYLKSLKKTDVHTVKNPISNSHTEVFLLESPEFPIYIPAHIPSEIQIVLEKYCLPIWFYNSDKHIQGEYRYLTIEFSEMIAYWLNEFNDSFNSLLEPISLFVDSLIYNVEVEKSAFWEKQFEEKKGKTFEEIIKINFSPPNIIRIYIPAEANSLFYGNTNEGERLFMFMLLRKLFLIYDYLDMSKQFIDETETNAIIDKYMPLGKKKKICIYDTSKLPELIAQDIPEPRKLDDININFILDDIGEHVINNRWEVGFTKTQQSKFVNKIVAYLWDSLKSIVRTLNFNDIICFLIQQNESITSKRVLSEMQLPMRLEIANYSTVINDFNNSYQKLIESGIACRFLVECIIGMNPKGCRPISEELYDQLLALSNEIVSWGFTSDLIINEVTDMKISILPSGRVGRSRENYDIAFNKFMIKAREKHTKNLNDRFDSYFHDSGIVKNQDDEEKNFEIASVAVQKEYGFSLTDLDMMYQLLIEISNRKESTIVVTEKDLFINELVVKGVSIDSSIALLETFSLVQRQQLFEYPGYQSIDRHNFYPWRFNRLFSFVRRPLILYSNGGKLLLLYGIRHLKVSIDNFYSLLNNGRMSTHVKTLEMKQLISQLTEPRGIIFNSRVADTFKGNNRYSVFENVKNIGKNKIEISTGMSLGDIDVLVIDHRKNKILVIECKNLLMSRTPYEFNLEVKKIFFGNDSLINKHHRRIMWVKEHVDSLIDFYRLEKSRKWKVKAIFVVDEPLISSYVMNHEEIQIVSYDELRKIYKTTKS